MRSCRVACARASVRCAPPERWPQLLDSLRDAARLHPVSFTPRVVLQNDTDHPLHVFYCNNLPCTEGVNGNDVILSPGKSSTDFWNSPDGDGPVGVATSPDDLLVGCFADPNPDQDAPPTATLRLSAPRPCPNQSGHPRIRLVEP
jgi:hypothetical protein